MTAQSSKPPTTQTGTISRRTLLVLGGAGAAALSLGVYFRPRHVEPPPNEGAPFAPDAWIRIELSGEITVVVGQSEMGQGILTALPMIVAEEMDADWSQVRVAQAPAHEAYANPLLPGQATGGSTSIRALYEPLRRAGATARHLLLAAAARAWAAPASECSVANSLITHLPTGRSIHFGDLAEGASAEEIPNDVSLKDPTTFNLIGQPIPRVDTQVKTTGKAEFGLDVMPPNHVVAVVQRSPVFGGTVKSFDDAAARAIPGVQGVYQIESGVAIVADGYWAASEGRKALSIEWESPAFPLSIEEGLTKALQESGRMVRRTGDRQKDNGTTIGANETESTVLEAEYDLPLLAHATMEPMNCTAAITGNGVTVWAPTQYQMGPRIYGGGTRGVAARIAGVEPEQVQVHTTFLGGGFGRRSETDFVAEAVTLAKRVGRPVKVVWSREDDIQHDFYRPAVRHRIRARIGPEGQPTLWHHQIACPSIISRFLPSWLPERLAGLAGPLKGGIDPTAVEGASELPYAVPQIEVWYHRARLNVPVGFWRSVGHSHSAFAVESFIDELAHAAGADPVAYRMALLADHPRHRAVLERATREAGWDSPLPADRARGVAIHASFGSYVAQVAEVGITGGAIQIHRVTCAIDCGVVVNPDTVRAQMEGAIAFGLTAALFGQITLDHGRVQQSNFHDYRILRLPEMPAVDVHLIPSAATPGGVGEPGTPPIAPAVANAVFALTGVRQRRLPLVVPEV